ncbi:mitochondrial carrier domain-containing protein [Mrakia frigida]|uniref:mitochondrial carrier domain-containing protein n=1 Tax=Mrakia frigida TaxID=29902 RepID=UPI003FCC0E4B
MRRASGGWWWLGFHQCDEAESGGREGRLTRQKAERKRRWATSSLSLKPSLPAPLRPSFASLFVTIGLVRMSDDKIKINSTHSRPGLDFFAGSAGGVAGVVVGHPFDTIKVRFQHPSFRGRYGSTAMAFKTIVREENVRGLYKGVMSPIAGISFVNGLVFASFKSAMEALRPEGGIEAPLKVFFAAGCISGAVSSLINTPIELLKIRQQASLGKPPSTLSLIGNIWTHEGHVRGLYRGFTACWLRDVGFGPYFLT